MKRRRWFGRALAAGLAMVAVASLVASRRPESGARGTLVPPGAPVLALGDSLTHGTGATAEAAYPARLAAASGWAVVNAGVPGHTSAQARERLPALLDEHRPALVIVSIGGNDLLRRQDEAALADNLRAIVDAARASGAQVLVVAVPRPTLASRVTGSLDDHPLYAQVAAAAGVPLLAGAWSEVLAQERLRSDAIHANADGYAAFTDALLAGLRASGLLAP